MRSLHAPGPLKGANLMGIPEIGGELAPPIPQGAGGAGGVDLCTWPSGDMASWIRCAADGEHSTAIRSSDRCGCSVGYHFVLPVAFVSAAPAFGPSYPDLAH